MAVLPRNTVDIIEQIVSEMTPDFVIGSKITNPDGTYTLTTTNTYWLHANQDIVIGGNKYTIIDFVINESITIKDINSAGEPIVNVFNIPAPLFIHGKTVKASKELAEQKDVFLRLPFIWLYEVLSETTIIDRLNPWGLESTPIIYFMDEAQSENWTSADHKVQILDPLRQMIQYFMFIIESNKSLYRTPDSYNTEARANWGRFVSDRGAVGRFFNDQLSGHKLDFDLVASKKACDTRLQINPCLVGVTVTTTDETVLGANDGTATANVTNAQGNITYLWDDPLAQTTQTATGLSAGIYTVIVTDDIITNPACTASNSGTVAAGTVTNPDDLSNLVGWVKADDETTINSGSVFDGDPVANVESVSPATHDYEQLTSNRQPTWFEDGFGTNDKPHIYCDGNECMSGINSLTDPYSIIVVVEPTSLIGNRRFVCGSGASANLIVEGALMTDDNQLEINSLSGTVIAATNVTLEPLIFKAIFNGSSSKIAINNSSYVTGDSGSVGMTNYGFGGYDSSGSFVLSSSLGKFAEIIIYSGAKTEAELDSLDGYINDKYDIY